jgi:hypothetical protein
MMNAGGSLNNVVNASSLFCHYMIPAIEHALNVLHRSSSVDDDHEQRRFTTVFRAAAVHCIATLALRVHSEGHQSLTLIWNVLSRIAPANPMEWLAMHWWRQHHRARILGHHRRSSNDDDDDDNTVLLTRLTTLSDVKSDDEMSDEEEVDTFVGVATNWPVQGVAVLVTSEACLADRPCVWSPCYQWYLFFPALVTRMAAELECQSSSASSDTRACAILVGLLQQIPRHTLTCPRKAETPGDPFPVFQWLVNAMIQAASTQKATHSGDNVESASAYFAIMNELVQRYQPESQLYLITQQLYRRCPYPAVRPKIVDLLRPYGQWSSKTLHEGVWLFVETAMVQCDNEEETQIALLSLLEVAPPRNVQQRLERIDASLETMEKPFLAFTMDRIKHRLSSV